MTRRARRCTATNAARSARRTAGVVPDGRELVQANRADRQAGRARGLHYHLHQADYWYVPFGRRESCCTTCAPGPPTYGDSRRWTSSGQPPWRARPAGRRQRVRGAHRHDDHLPRRRLLQPGRRARLRWAIPPSGPTGVSTNRSCPSATARTPARPICGERRPYWPPADVRTVDMRLLVTGGAGFIGSNFVRYCGQHRRDGRRSRQAHLRREPRLDGIEIACRSSQGDICDADLVDDLLADHSTRRALRGRVAQRHSLSSTRPRSSRRT